MKGEKKESREAAFFNKTLDGFSHHCLPSTTPHRIPVLSHSLQLKGKYSTNLKIQTNIMHRSGREKHSASSSSESEGSDNENESLFSGSSSDESESPEASSPERSPSHTKKSSQPGDDRRLAKVKERLRERYAAIESKKNERKAVFLDIAPEAKIKKRATTASTITAQPLKAVSATVNSGAGNRLTTNNVTIKATSGAKKTTATTAKERLAQRMKAQSRRRVK